MSAPRPIPEVTLVDPDRMNLLGLMLASLLRRRLEQPRARRYAERLHGCVAIQAGGMQITLHFARDRIQIERGPSRVRTIAAIRGSLIALLDAALGRRRVHHFLRGELVAWGWPTTLWQLLSLVQTKQSPA